MKFFHTADWHLGKLVQGTYMTEDQSYVLDQFLQAIEEERPDAIIIAGDIYDRAVPPTDAVHLLDEVLGKIILQYKTPVLAVGGNHDSPGRLNFASKIMRENGLHIVGQLTEAIEPIVLSDDHGEVHFHLVPYGDPSTVRNIFQDEAVRTHNDAMRKIVDVIEEKQHPNARHVFVGHAFVTPYGEAEENTSESERPLSIGGAEYVSAEHFQSFHYTALGHLHRAHFVSEEKIRYAGSILKYSLSEEHHEKGFYVVEIDETGGTTLDKRVLKPRRDIRTVEATMEELLTHDRNEDYVFVRLLDKAPVLHPMEKVRTIYPNAMHVERKSFRIDEDEKLTNRSVERTKMSDLELFHAFYKEVKGEDVSPEMEAMFVDVLEKFLKEEREDLSVTHEKVGVKE